MILGAWPVGIETAAEALRRLSAPPLQTQAEATEAAATGGWEKYRGNPVMGGNYGTCFDVSVLKEGNTYRMWLSWRPKQSIAQVESKNGIHWSEPTHIVLGPRKEPGWEDDVNRPVVIKREDGYQMWYTGHSHCHLRIGDAKSPDGRERSSDFLHPETREL